MENSELVVEKTEVDLSNGFSGVRNIDPDKPLETSAEEAKVEVTVDPRIQELEGQVNEWKEKATQLEARGPEKEVVYQLPEDYVSIMENAENRRLLDLHPEQMSDVTLFKQVLQRESPWLTTDTLLNAEIKKQFPDAELDIPANLGLSEEDGWAKIKFIADGERAAILKQKSDLQEKIEASKQVALQAKGQEQSASTVEDQMKFLTTEFNAGLAAKVIPQVDIALEGYQFPSVSDAEIQEMFESGNLIFKVDPEKGFVPAVQEMHDLLLGRKTQSSLKPMVEAAKRVAPIEARKALEDSIAGKQIDNKDQGGIRDTDPNAKQVYVNPFSGVRNLQT